MPTGAPCACSTLPFAYEIYPDRVGIVHMEAIAEPMSWSDLPEQARPFFEALRSPAGERMVLEVNVFNEKIMPARGAAAAHGRGDGHYRKPFLEPGEHRRPMLSQPRSLPLDGDPAATFSKRLPMCIRWWPCESRNGPG